MLDLIGFLGGPILLFVASVFKSVFGREFLIRAIVCDIAVDLVPDTSGASRRQLPKPFKASKPLSPRSLWSFVGLWSFVVSLWFSPGGTVISGGSLHLRHRIYDHPDCVDEIVRWLRRVT